MAYKHGMNGTRIYREWCHMRERCFSKRHKSYKHYGGKGIKVCEEWDNSFIPFYEWAMANGYNDTLTLDRIDVNGNYEPSNCRWITNLEQQRNKKNNRFIEINGEKKAVSEWANIYNLDRHTIYYRLDKGITGLDLFKAGRNGGGIGGNPRRS